MYIALHVIYPLFFPILMIIILCSWQPERNKILRDAANSLHSSVCNCGC